MSAAYRSATLVCPACGDLLAPQTVDESIIDVCPACRGIWVDWFDGELTVMVRGGATPSGDDEPAPVPRGNEACPRCTVPLAEERYADRVANVLRCGECSGAFVPRSSIAPLLDEWPPIAPPPGTESAFDRLAAVLRKWLDWDPS